MTYRILIALMVFSLAVIGLAQDEPITVVASHSILADVVHNVAGDQAAVSSVMPVGADPHSFEASPSDLTALANADVIFVNGALFEEGLLESIENAGEGLQIIEASQCVEIIAVGQAHDDHDEEADEHDDHDDEDADDHENHDDEHDEDDDEHEEGDDHERERP